MPLTGIRQLAAGADCDAAVRRGGALPGLALDALSRSAQTSQVIQRCQRQCQGPTPKRHAGGDVQVLAKRDAINHAAHEANPACRSGKTRNWAPADTVSLNPERELQVSVIRPEKEDA